MTPFRWFSPEISDNSSRYDLLLYISESHFYFGFYDDVQRVIIGFSELDITVLNDEKNAVAILKKAVDTEPVLSAKVKSCKVCFHSEKNTLVPSDLFEPKSVNEYFDWVADLDEKEILVHDFIKNPDCFNIYCVPKKLLRKLNDYFVNPKLWSLDSVLIYNLLRESKGTREKKLYVFRENQSVHILFIENGKLIFSNRFPAETEEDLVYYVLAVCEQLQLNTHTTKVVLMGDIEPDDSYFHLLASYLEQLAFADFPKGVYIPEQLQQLPAHRFHHLFALSLCE